MVRRLALTSFLLLFVSSLVQIEVALLIAVAGIVGTQKIAPHWSRSADRVQYGCGW